MSEALPFLISAGGSLIGGAQAREAGNYNAAVLSGQARSAQQQGYADEQTQRRQGRQVAGAQAAAIAEAGIGNQGTAAKLIDQSSKNAELDALNIRYGAQSRASGLLAQAAAEKYAGKAKQTQSFFFAGSDLLQGYGGYKNKKAGAGGLTAATGLGA